MSSLEIKNQVAVEITRMVERDMGVTPERDKFFPKPRETEDVSQESQNVGGEMWRLLIGVAMR